MNAHLRASILTVTCSKCTRQARFGVGNGKRAPEDTANDVARAGWVQRGGQTICPRCPQTTEERERRMGKVAVAG